MQQRIVPHRFPAFAQRPRPAFQTGLYLCIGKDALSRYQQGLHNTTQRQMGHSRLSAGRRHVGNAPGLFDDELTIVKNTTSTYEAKLKTIISKKEILEFQQLIRKIPINDNVLKYAVTLASKTRPKSELAPDITKKYIKWGAGPRASQYLVLGAKCHAAINGKYSPDIEDVRAIASYVLRHRIVRNFKAEAEGINEEKVIESLF